LIRLIAKLKRENGEFHSQKGSEQGKGKAGKERECYDNVRKPKNNK